MLVFAAGAAAAGVHAVGGLMLTPFFGDSPFLWANVVASFPLSLALGIGIGHAAAEIARRAKRRDAALPFGLGAAAGLLALAVPLVLAPLARAVLDRDPDSLAAPPATVLLLVTLPGAAAAAVLRQQRARDLLLFAIGGIAGVIGSAPALHEPQGYWGPWQTLGTLGLILVAAAAAGLGRRARIVSALLAAALAGGFLARPNEVREAHYLGALERGWKLRVGPYYLETAGRRVLDGSEVARRYEDLRGKLARSEDRSAAAVLILETLKNAGPVSVTGEGLRKILDLHLPGGAKAAILPLLQRVEAVRSDGVGTVGFSLRRPADGLPVRVEVPDASGGTTTLEIRSDFTLSIHVTESPGETRTTVDVGPVEIEKAGFFGSNDTCRTPIVIEDARMFVDAHLLGFTVTASERRVVVTARAQGPIGAIQESVVQDMEMGGGEKSP